MQTFKVYFDGKESRKGRAVALCLKCQETFMSTCDLLHWEDGNWACDNCGAKEGGSDDEPCIEGGFQC